MIRHCFIATVLAAFVAALGLTAPSTALADQSPQTADESQSTTADETESTTAVTLDEMRVQDDEDAEPDDEDAEVDEPAPGIDEAMFVQTVATSALWGAGAGALTGLGFYLLTLGNTSAWVIPQFAGGGILLGGVVGVVQAVARADQPAGTRAADGRVDSVDYVTRDAPTTIDITILGGQF